MIKYTATREYLDKKRYNFRIAPMKLNSLSRFNETFNQKDRQRIYSQIRTN